MTQRGVFRRTFEAAKHPKGSEERARLNFDPLTSEYSTGSPYLSRRPAFMSDGTPNEVQGTHDKCHRTKAEAQAYLEAHP